ncbi:hypothetical protein EVAR_64895_1 [Eumeta japonica]|uniref:Uncharacterized protein n=1 Tax=Eumeta variegata TaxID=151549 RepID=A0A4C1ZWH2_EUMVA|nr:hypothetical protein EVAR_64895_1 [Eumeta japonica]
MLRSADPPMFKLRQKITSGDHIRPHRCRSETTRVLAITDAGRRQNSMCRPEWADGAPTPRIDRNPCRPESRFSSLAQSERAEAAPAQPALVTTSTCAHFLPAVERLKGRTLGRLNDSNRPLTITLPNSRSVDGGRSGPRAWPERCYCDSHLTYEAAGVSPFYDRVEAQRKKYDTASARAPSAPRPGTCP